MKYQKVSKEQFFHIFDNEDIHLHVQQPIKYPYTCLWKTKTGQIKAKSVDVVNGETQYYMLVKE